MAHHTPGPLRTLGLLIRALFGLAVLAALVGGVPYVLLAIGHQPAELIGSGTGLMSRDDGTLLLVVVTLIGWAAWAAFTLSALVEVVAVARRRSAPRIKGLSGLQSFASFLVGAIVLLAPTAASAATSTPAHAVTQSAGHQTPGTTTSTSPTASSEESTAWPTHTVTSTTESPWGLAVDTLGNGQRWKDIAALNPDIPELQGGDIYLPLGTVIKLPADARPQITTSPPAPRTTTAAAATRTAPASAHQSATPVQDAGKDHKEKEELSSVESGNDSAHTTEETVRSGNTLWGLAEDAYGDANKWPKIYNANKGVIGGNPDLIFPGQHLVIPPQDGHTTAPAPRTGHSPTHPPKTQTPDQDKATPTAPSAPDSGSRQNTAPPSSPSARATTTPGPAPSRTAGPSATSPAPAPAASSTPDQSAHRTPVPVARAAEEDGEQSVAPATLWLGAGVLAAALVGTLATRRRLQQRRRRVGRRIPMPTGSAAATEQSLRAVQQPLDLLDTALRTLALNLASVRRELPVIEAVVLHDARIELHLAADTTPCKPFTATNGRQDLWTCTATSPDLADAEALTTTGAPYPALVSLGWDPQGHLVLIDLEHVGILHLAGDVDLARHVLQAISVELANTPLSDHLELTAFGTTAPGLEAAAPERVARTQDMGQAVTELAAHTAEQRHALTTIGANSLRAARLQDDTGGAFTPHVVLAQDLDTAVADPTAVTALFDALSSLPRTAGAVVTAAPTQDLSASRAWTLDCQGADQLVVLPGSGLPVHLQGLSDSHFADAIELLTLAASDTDVPAPAWTEAQPAPQVWENPYANEEEGALPTEYAELEQDLLGTDDPEEPEDRDVEEAAEDATGAPEEAKKEPATGLSLAEVLNDDPEASAAAAPAAPGDVLPLTSAYAAPLLQAVSVTAPAPTAQAVTEASAGAESPVLESVMVEGPGPVLSLLGPLRIDGEQGRVDPSRKRINLELVTFLALHPGADHHEIDEALWPGQVGGKQRRDPVISRTRSWLGRANFPRIQDNPDRRYRLGPNVTSDWEKFKNLALQGKADRGEDGDLALRRALSLVRGRPLSATDTTRYTWATTDIEEMLAAIVDTAHHLSTRRREAGDTSGALWAAHRGLLADDSNEILHRAIFRAHHQAGDIAALRDAAHRLRTINDGIDGGVTVEDDTAELLQDLLPRTATHH